MKLQRSREAFSLLTAISIMVLMATVSILVFNLSGKMVKGTTTQFNREQAMLLAKSYTEYAVMAITANDRNNSGSCLTTIDSDNVIRDEVTAGGYRVRVNISYIGTNGAVASGTICPASNVFSDAVVTDTTPLTAVVDVYVQYKDIDHHVSNFNLRPWITYHKRTLQKI